MGGLRVISSETRHTTNALPYLDDGVSRQITCGEVLSFFIGSAVKFVRGMRDAVDVDRVDPIAHDRKSMIQPTVPI
jgi:hypothetical protein